MDKKVEVLTITISEAARRLGLSRNSAYQAAKKGELPVLRIGRRLLVSVFALEQLLGSPRSLSSEEALEQTARR